ncbi:HET-domain-containing protein, partial [Pyrenochaeta sp. DS3sAY3a]
MIVEWISTCRETHQNCQASSLARLKAGLPTRLLDVSQSSSADKMKARLCYTKEIPPDAEYLSLSHTWGVEEFFTLKKKNEDELMRDIPITLLPQSFQDAIYVTGALKHRYLWIDSLCIIQDDPDDWRKECMRMADVYKNAVLNLSASWVSSNKNGFLVNQRSNNPVPVLVNKDCPEENLVISEDSPWESVWSGPLFTRAWVLQEQILAPRAVHFTENQIHWECEDLYANEVIPLGVPTVETRGIHEDPASLYPIWMQIIEEFSSRRITVDSDRLPALDGLASEFAQGLEVAKSTFIYGLWRNDLPRQLLWRQT